MEILFLGNITSRFRGLGFKLQIGFLIAAVLIILWFALTVWILPYEVDELLSLFQVDKLLHFTGGFFAAELILISSGLEKKRIILLAVLLIGIVWEIWEVVFLPDQLTRFNSHPIFWASDTFFDLIADVLGAYLFTETIKS